MSSELIDDLLAPEVVHDPYPYLAELRATEPVHWSERHRGWLLTRYDDQLAALADDHLSSNRVNQLLAAMAPERRRVLGPVLGMIGDWMVTTDPPAHTRLRQLANRAFRQARVTALTDRIEALVSELLDDFVAEGRTSFIEHFAYPLPATVICELLGAPTEDRDRLRAWSDELALVAFGTGAEGSERHRRALAGLVDLLDYFGTLIDSKRRSPGDDMISSLLAPEKGVEPLSEDELRGMCALTLFAGHETTTNLLANGLLALLLRPQQLAMVRTGQDTNRAVEELLRFDGPIKVLTRWVVADTEIRGRPVRAGERVYLVVAAANRDPDQFPDPDRLDLTRHPNVHLAFGRGPHTCIGQHLARIESRVALARVVERLPGLRLSDAPIRWKPSLSSRSMEELSIAWDRGSP
jgi:cytochrome P450